MLLQLINMKKMYVPECTKLEWFIHIYYRKKYSITLNITLNSENTKSLMFHEFMETAEYNQKFIITSRIRTGLASSGP